MNTLASFLLRKATYGVAVLALAVSFGAQAAQACETDNSDTPCVGSIVTNGGFEDDMTGWTATGDMSIANTFPHSGGDYAVFADDQTGTLSQTLATQAGQNYIFTFYANDFSSKNSINVLWNGATVSGSPTSIPGRNLGDYIGYTFTVAATQATTALEFIVKPAGDFIPYTSLRLDDICVTPTGTRVTTTPEPTSFALLALGGLALVGLTLRQRRSTLRTA